MPSLFLVPAGRARRGNSDDARWSFGRESVVIKGFLPEMNPPATADRGEYSSDRPTRQRRICAVWWCMNDEANPVVWTELDTALAAPTLVITTYRRSGAGVATGVWAARIDGRFFFTTPSSTGKVKRLAHSTRVTFGPGDKRGRAVPGPRTEAEAKLVDDQVLLSKFRAAMRSKGAIMSRVIEAMYKVRRKDTRLLYELLRR